MDLQEFMNQYATVRPGVDLLAIGPASTRLYGRLRNEGWTRSLIANNFWRAFLASNAFPSVLQRLGASPRALTTVRNIVVPRENLSRYDLLVLDPMLQRGTSPRALVIDQSVFGINDADAGARLAASEGVPPSIGPDFIDLAQEAVFAGRDSFVVVLAPAPEAQQLYVPSNALNVDQFGAVSTAGVVVECQNNLGVIGVTAALHGVSGPNAVTVDGQAGTIARAHSISDSAFIQLGAQPTVAPIATKGVMSGFAPRGSQSAYFIGSNSGKQNTTITGWDPQIPTPSAYRQALIYTGRDAQQGDSGAALITDDDWIVGFAFERSLPNQNPVQCSWIWAESVLKALNVKLI